MQLCNPWTALASGFVAADDCSEEPTEMNELPIVKRISTGSNLLDNFILYFYEIIRANKYAFAVAAKIAKNCNFGIKVIRQLDPSALLFVFD